MTTAPKPQIRYDAKSHRKQFYTRHSIITFGSKKIKLIYDRVALTSHLFGMANHEISHMISKLHLLALYLL